MAAYTELEETVQVMQILIADGSRSLIEFLHCFRTRLLGQFCHLLFTEPGLASCLAAPLATAGS